MFLLYMVEKDSLSIIIIFKNLTDYYLYTAE